MKISGQKFIFRIALSIMLMAGASDSIFSQTEATPELTKFLILFETTDDGMIKLTCQQGCAFKELSFALKTDNTQTIDQYGMSSLERHESEKDSDLANFLFNVKKTQKGLSFEGVQGTAWKSLSFTCPENKCRQSLDQNGMVEDK